jgi:hypothetical protein
MPLNSGKFAPRLEAYPKAFSSSVEEHRSLTGEDVRRRLGSEAEDSFVAGAFDDSRGIAGFGGYAFIISGLAANRTEQKRKAPATYCRDASAALPRNCQTTGWILKPPNFV